MLPGEGGGAAAGGRLAGWQGLCQGMTADRLGCVRHSVPQHVLVLSKV
jgi:hypothetical protein